MYLTTQHAFNFHPFTSSMDSFFFFRLQIFTLFNCWFSFGKCLPLCILIYFYLFIYLLFLFFLMFLKFFIQLQLSHDSKLLWRQNYFRVLCHKTFFNGQNEHNLYFLGFWKIVLYLNYSLEHVLMIFSLFFFCM